jgi:hypothetical protein
VLLLPESLIQAAFQTTARLDSTPMAILASMLDTAWWLMMGVPNVLPDRGHGYQYHSRVGARGWTYGQERTWRRRKEHAEQVLQIHTQSERVQRNEAE